MNRFAAAGLAVFALTGTASAADLIVDPPVPVIASSNYDWSGFYLGVMGGYGLGVSDAPAVWAPFTINDSGLLLGVTAGVNQQFDNLVLGLEADAAWTNIGGSVFEPGNGITFTTTIQALASLRARAGFAVDQALLFATGGLAGSVTQLGNDYSNTTAAAASFGWTAGLGAEFAVTDSISLKAEYAYIDLGTATFDADALFVGSPATTVATVLHTVKVGANAHF